MKLLSDTAEGGKVVELTRGEWHELILLVSSIEGKEEREAHWDLQGGNQSMDFKSYSSDLPLQGVFGAIMAFTQAKFRLNELERTVKYFRNFIDKNESVPE